MLVLGFRLGLGLGLRLGVRARVGEGLEFSARNDVRFTLNRHPNLNLTLILICPKNVVTVGCLFLRHYVLIHPHKATTVQRYGCVHAWSLHASALQLSASATTTTTIRVCFLSAP